MLAIVKNHKIGSGTVHAGPRAYCQLLTPPQVWVKWCNFVDGNKNLYVGQKEKSQNWLTESHSLPYEPSE